MEKYIHNIKAWFQYWRENTLYGLLCKEIYKLAGQNKNVMAKHSASYRHYQHYSQNHYSSFFNFSNLWSSGIKSHPLVEHFLIENYDNPLGAKIDDILGSFSQASYTPKLKISTENIFPQFSAKIRDRLEKFFNDSENRAIFLNCVDSILCTGYSALKINYKKSWKGFEICMENVDYQELCFFSPFAKSSTKSDSFHDLPNNFCGKLHIVEKKYIKDKYKKKLKGAEPATLPLNNETVPLNILVDNRDKIMIAEYYTYTNDGKVERILFCENYILEQDTFDWDFLPMVYVNGASSYTSDIQQVFSIFDKALSIQKQLNILNDRIAYLTKYTKCSTFALGNKFTLDEKFKNSVMDISDSPAVVFEQSTMGIDEQLPPMLLQPVELPQTLLAERDAKILFLDQMMRGHYDSNDSNFGESGRALELKQQNKSNLFARQLSGLSMAIEKIAEYYKKMFFHICINNEDDDIVNDLLAFGDYETYTRAITNINFDIIIDPNVSLSKEVTRRAIAEALQYMPEEVTRQVLTKEYIKNMQIPDPSSLLLDLEKALEEQRIRQEELANKPDPAIVVTKMDTDAKREIALQKAIVDLEKSREKNVANIAIAEIKQEAQEKDKMIKEFESMKNQGFIDVEKQMEIINMLRKDKENDNIEEKPKPQDE